MLCGAKSLAADWMVCAMKNEFYVNKVRAIVCSIGSVATLVPCITCLWYGELFGTAVLAIGFLWFFVQVVLSDSALLPLLLLKPFLLQLFLFLPQFVR